MNYWAKVCHLFEVDDGSLPDIFVEDITSAEIIEIYQWVMSHGKAQNDKTVWSITENCDIPLCQIENPALACFSGDIEPFRHCISGLHINGVALPELSIMIEPTAVSFDYRMGPEWKEPELLALFELLRSILKIAPTARIFQAHEGEFEHPNPEFNQALGSYVSASAP